MSTTNFQKYISKFSKDVTETQTHVAFNKRKYNVPDEDFGEFYKTYHSNLTKGEKMFIIEKVNNCNFAYFLDIDTPKETKNGLKMEDVENILEIVKSNIEAMVILKGKELDNIVSKRTINSNCTKYHINFPCLIVRSDFAKILTKSIIAETLEKYGNKLANAIDCSVYNTGLRLFGSEKAEEETKKEKESHGDSNYEYSYRIIINNQPVELKDTTFDMFKKCIVRRKKDTKLTEINSEFVLSCIPKTIKKAISKNEEITSFLAEVNEINSDNKVFNSYNILDNIGKITSPRSEEGKFSYYITIDGQKIFCPFKNRCHQRENSPIYIELNSYGLYLRCRDSDCLKEKLELKMPLTFKVNYPELYLSTRTTHWKSSNDLEVTPKITKVLEESLNMSHFKIAKVAFNIYKERFRIDDIKNPDWYEFDGSKWKKSHSMNIIISEELKKYYNTIKVNPEDIESNEENDEETGDKKAQVNIKNDIIGKIIDKLENGTFKKSVLNEMYYLFKSFEPDFISKLDANPYLLGFKNGVYDFEKEGSFRKGKHDDYLTFSTGYDYTEYDPDCTEVKDIYSFLEKIIPNKKVLEYLLKVLGRSLIGIPDEHFYIFTGSGANGKSTLFNFLEDALGDYNTAVDVSLLTNNRALSSAASPDVIRIKGRRQLSFSEPEYGQTIKTGLMKAFTGGDTIISRELYKAPISFKLQASLFLACNDLPNLSSIDGGTVRRVRVLEFTSRFCDSPKKANEFHIDPDVKHKQKMWRPYFMSILIHYYHLYQKEMKEFGKIEEPEEVQLATNKYKNDNDKFNDFFEDCMTYNDSFDILNIKTIYGLFGNWWVSNNTTTNKIPEQKELIRAMKLKYDPDDYDKFKGFKVRINLQNEETFIDTDTENY
jgi:P4 family phage/plasmid primase-like protien